MRLLPPRTGFDGARKYVAIRWLRHGELFEEDARLNFVDITKRRIWVSFTGGFIVLDPRWWIIIEAKLGDGTWWRWGQWGLWREGKAGDDRA